MFKLCALSECLRSTVYQQCKLFLYVCLYLFPVKFPCGRTFKTAVRSFDNGLNSTINKTAQSSDRTVAFTSSIFKTENQTSSTASKSKGSKITPSFSKLPRWNLDDYLMSPMPTESHPKSRIVGGNPALPGEIPWQVRANLQSKRFVHPIM